MRRRASLPGLLALLALGCSPAEPPAVPAPAATGAAKASTTLADDPAAPAPPGRPAPWFEDATLALGLDFVHEAGFTAEKQLPETMGAGAVLADLDGDGALDAYLVQSGPLPRGADAVRRAELPPNRTYLSRLTPGRRDVSGGRSEAGVRLVDTTVESGDAADRGYGMGAAAGDIDGDGDTDLYVTNLGPDVLLRNDGRARFTRPTGGPREDNGGIADARWTGAATFFDSDADGDLDLYVVAYLDVDLEHPVWCGRQEPGWRSYCHPDEYPGLPDRFWRNRGDGTFEEATRAAGFDEWPGKGLGALAADLDGDGALDLYVANDSVENRLWRGLGDGTFRDETLLSGTGVNANGATEAGMGLALGDVRGEGKLAIVVTNLDHESNTVYEPTTGARGGASSSMPMLYTDNTVRSGLEAASRMPVGFGVVLEDFDLDGDLDLAVANGHIIDNIQLYDDAQTWAQHAQLFENRSGTFREVPELAGPLAATPFVGRGLYSGDLDGDGAPDLLLTQCGGPARVFRNLVTGAAPAPGKSRGATLRGAPHGTRVTAHTAQGRTLLRLAGGTPSYFGRTDDAVVLGLGLDDRLTRLELAFPGGKTAVLEVTEALGSGPLRLEQKADVWSLRRP